MLSAIEIEKRLPVWEALADLFLDTELDETTHRYIASVVSESGFKPEEIHTILWREVFPGVGDNLRCVAGEWADFDPQWLKERILSVMSGETKSLSYGGIIPVKTLRDITQKEWEKVCHYLPEDFRKNIVELGNKDVTVCDSHAKKWWKFWNT